MPPPLRLTALAKGDGCSKLAPEALKAILSNIPAAAAFPNLIVGPETSDDAAVWRLSDSQALVISTDIFTPMVDDPEDFGRIAATHAISNIYAMGATPILALAIAGMPIRTLGGEIIGKILAAGAAVCATAGIPVAGGHTIESTEPVYGLVVLGLAHPDRVLSNSRAREGDSLILTKPLGLGVLAAAYRSDRLDNAGYAQMLRVATQPNSIGRELPGLEGVHAVTDIGGFGLIGNALEMALGAGLVAEIYCESPPILPGVERLVRAGAGSAAMTRNWESYADLVQDLAGIARWRRDVLSDPQTGGGLLLSVSPSATSEVLAVVRARGFQEACVIGKMAGRSLANRPRVRFI